MKLRTTILKYHSWYLCQISLQIMLLPILIQFDTVLKRCNTAMLKGSCDVNSLQECGWHDFFSWFMFQDSNTSLALFFLFFVFVLICFFFLICLRFCFSSSFSSLFCLLPFDIWLPGGPVTQAASRLFTLLTKSWYCKYVGGEIK